MSEVNSNPDAAPDALKTTAEVEPAPATTSPVSPVSPASSASPADGDAVPASGGVTDAGSSGAAAEAPPSGATSGLKGDAPLSGSTVAEAVQAVQAVEAAKDAMSAEVVEKVEVIDPLEELRAENAKLKDGWMRSAADFDNFRKRSRREVEDARKSGREELLRQILPVFDNLERGVQSAQRATDAKAVADGLAMVMKQLIDTLERVGIQRVRAVGQPFDPSMHEAIQQLESSEHPPGTVVGEVQAGYMQGDRLVRAAMVIVAKAMAEQPGDGATDETAN